MHSHTLSLQNELLTLLLLHTWNGLLRMSPYPLWRKVKILILTFNMNLFYKRISRKKILILSYYKYLYTYTQRVWTPWWTYHCFTYNLSKHNSKAVVTGQTANYLACCLASSSWQLLWGIQDSQFFFLYLH